MKLLSIPTAALLTLTFAVHAAWAASPLVPWTTSRIHGTPEPPPPFVVERTHEALTFAKPLDIAPLPGSDRLVVLEETGHIAPGVVNKTTSVAAVDLMPTGCAAANVSQPASFKPDGENMLPALLGKEVHAHAADFMGMARQGRAQRLLATLGHAPWRVEARERLRHSPRTQPLAR